MLVESKEDNPDLAQHFLGNRSTPKDLELLDTMCRTLGWCLDGKIRGDEGEVSSRYDLITRTVDLGNCYYFFTHSHCSILYFRDFHSGPC